MLVSGRMVNPVEWWDAHWIADSLPDGGKVIVFNKHDFEWAQQEARKVSEGCYLYMQPEWSKREEMMPQQFMEAGIYENDYVREEGVWKIKRLDYMMQWQADYERGWSKTLAHLQPAT